MSARASGAAGVLQRGFGGVERFLERMRDGVTAGVYGTVHSAPVYGALYGHGGAHASSPDSSPDSLHGGVQWRAADGATGDGRAKSIIIIIKIPGELVHGRHTATAS